MANANRGLGRGLGALLGDAALQTESADSLYLPISQVESCAGQPRKHFDDAALADLADSIREHGIIQPLTVRKLASGYYQIIAGERRWRAARLAGLTQVPAIVIEADDRKAMELAPIAAQGLSVRQTEALVKRLTAEKKEREPSIEEITHKLHAHIAEEELAQSLGRGVKIVAGRKKGRIELDYYDMDDLNDLLDALGTLQQRKNGGTKK